MDDHTAAQLQATCEKVRVQEVSEHFNEIRDAFYETFKKSPNASSQGFASRNSICERNDSTTATFVFFTDDTSDMRQLVEAHIRIICRMK